MISDQQFRLFPECSDQIGSALHGFEPAPSEVRDLVEIRSTQVGDLSVLEIAPDVLNRIEFRCVGWRVVKDDTIALGLDEFEHQSAFVGFEAVQNYQQLSLDLTRKCAKKLDQLRGLDAAGEEPEVEVPESHAGDGDLFALQRSLLRFQAGETKFAQQTHDMDVTARGLQSAGNDFAHTSLCP